MSDDIDKELEEIDDSLDTLGKVSKDLSDLIHRPRIIQPEQGYLPFCFDPEALNERWVINADSQVLFKPVALMVWGFTSQTMIEIITIDTQVQGTANMGNIPASFFGTAKTYEKVVEDFKANGISPPTWVTFRTMGPGSRAQIVGRGPLSHAVFLGKIAR